MAARPNLLIELNRKLKFRVDAMLFFPSRNNLAERRLTFPPQKQRDAWSQVKRRFVLWLPAAFEAADNDWKRSCHSILVPNKHRIFIPSDSHLPTSMSTRYRSTSYINRLKNVPIECLFLVSTKYNCIHGLATWDILCKIICFELATIKCYRW